VKRVSFSLAIFCSFGFSAEVPNLDPCEAYLRDFYGVTYFEPTSYWRGKILHNTPLTANDRGVERAKWIVAQYFDRSSALWLETFQNLKHWAAGTDGALRTVFRSIEIAYYTTAAAEHARQIDSLLESDAKILQLGGATGWLAGCLLTQYPERNIHVVEGYDEGLDLAQRRWRVLLPKKNQPTTTIGMFSQDFVPPHEDFNAMVVQNTYFRLHDSTRAGFFQRAWDILRNPSGPADSSSLLIITEPISGRERLVLPWAQNAVEEAIRNGAPHSEYDAALFGLYFSGMLGEAIAGQAYPAPKFVSQREILERAEAAGFVLSTRFSAADGVGDTFIFHKR
jgi:hypothetical protein